jgi:hypothetical protein
MLKQSFLTGTKTVMAYVLSLSQHLFMFLHADLSCSFDRSIPISGTSQCSRPTEMAQIIIMGYVCFWDAVLLE